MTIWTLFSIANEYDQPDNNLEAWWSKKPTFIELAEVIGITVDVKKGNRELGELLKGKEVRIEWADYRLEEITEGKYSTERMGDGV